MYEFKIEKFEGPLDLLLHLIEKAKIDIKDIFISEITSQFIDYVDKHKYTMDDVSEFLETAATLMYIKSKRLLPQRQTEDDEEDLETEFVLKLEEYNRFKKLAGLLREEIDCAPKTFTKYKDELILSEDRIDLGEVTLDQLVNAFTKLLEKRQGENELPVLTSQRVMRNEKFTIIEKMDYILTKVKKKVRIAFEDLFEENDRADMVVSFLSVLELLSQGKLRVYQNKAYDNIVVEYREEN